MSELTLNSGTPKPLLPRNPNPAMNGWTFKRYKGRNKKNFLGKINKALSADDDSFTTKLQFLIDTVSDLTTKKHEILKLWEKLPKLIEKHTGYLNSFDSIYIYPLVSLTGEAAFTIDERADIMTKLACSGTIIIYSLKQQKYGINTGTKAKFESKKRQSAPKVRQITIKTSEIRTRKLKLDLSKKLLVNNQFY